MYRFMEVGWYLKNPKYPIWILGSETHLTVGFSREKLLVIDDEQLQQQEMTPMKKALKIFRKYDTEKKWFYYKQSFGTGFTRNEA